MRPNPSTIRQEPRARALVAMVAILTLAWHGGPIRAESKAAPAPITVFLAQGGITMDPGWPTATAVAVRDGKILSVGSLDDLKPWLDANPHTIDRSFAERILFPGLIEPHGHPLIGGTTSTRPLPTHLPMSRAYGRHSPASRPGRRRWPG